MLRQVTISNEVISIDVSRELGKLIEAQIAKMRKCFEDTKLVSDALLKELSDIVFTTGLRVEFVSSPYMDAWMFSPTFWGHHGTAWNSWGISINISSKDGIKNVGKVDLQKLTVSGKLTDDMKFKACIGNGFFTAGFTDAEITAILLHEIGHGFNTFVTLGDYIYLNYMLSDGIDILLGNKRNELKLEILDHTWVVNNLDKDEREAFINSPSPASARRAILSVWKKAPRHYLFANPVSAHKREEQMADMFTSRLGYGRALVMGLDRMHKQFGYAIDERPSWWGDLLRISAMIVFIPITLMYVMTVSGTNSMKFADRYDKPKDRLNKIRMDLITQLKNIKNKSLLPIIQEDIDVIDEILKEYHTASNAFDKLAELASPNLRKERRLLEHEENLESLLNNDLFVTAQRFKS